MMDLSFLHENMDLIMQLMAACSIILTVIIAIWSLKLQRVETIKQNNKMIEQNCIIIEKLSNIEDLMQFPHKGENGII